MMKNVFVYMHANTCKYINKCVLTLYKMSHNLNVFIALQGTNRWKAPENKHA